MGTADPIYLDNAATTRPAPEVLAAMRPWLDEGFGNASAIYYGLGRQAADAVEAARVSVAELMNAAPEEVFFTSGSTEASNWALSEALFAPRRAGRRRAIASAIEHHAVLEPLRALSERHGFALDLLPVDARGRVEEDGLDRALAADDAAVVSIMLANNEVGVLADIAPLARKARERGAWFHTDGTQAFGKIPVDVQALGIDFLSLSAHKFNGPKGVGALYVRRGTKLAALIHGGGQERGRRAGTHNVAGIVGMGAAARLAKVRAGDETERRRQFDLVEALWSRLAGAIPRLRRNGDPVHRLPNMLSVCVEGAEGEALLGYLDMHGIQASSGSACTSGALDPSHVLLAMGAPAEIAHGSVRFSLGHETTAGQIERVAAVFPGVAARIRSMSATWKE